VKHEEEEKNTRDNKSNEKYVEREMYKNSIEVQGCNITEFQDVIKVVRYICIMFWRNLLPPALTLKSGDSWFFQNIDTCLPESTRPL